MDLCPRAPPPGPTMFPRLLAVARYPQSLTKGSHRIYISPVGRLLHPAVALVYGESMLTRVPPTQQNGHAEYAISAGLKGPYKFTTSVLGLLSHKVRAAPLRCNTLCAQPLHSPS